MDINLFAKIVKKLGKDDLENFAYTYNNKIYGFKNVGDDNWDDEGKYQYKIEHGQLIEMNGDYQEIQSFNFCISRSVQRNGSYFTDYNYDYEPYEMFEIKEVLIPEVIIPAHTESKWNRLSINLNNIVDEKEEARKRIEAEKIRLEKEAKAEKELLNDDIDADILKVGHHGSKTSTTVNFLEKISPQVAFIQVGAKNRYSHPSLEVTQRLEGFGIRYHRTDLDGHMEVITDGETFQVKKY